MTAGIYLITNKINGHMNVGGSIDIERRFNEHKRGKDTDKQAIDKAILKYGAENFTYQIITELPPDWKIIGEHEKYWIKFYNTFEDSNHYNLTEGGEGISGFKRPEHSERMKGENNPNYGNPQNYNHSIKTREKISESNKGKDAWNKGKTGYLSNECRKKISDANKGKNNFCYGKYEEDHPAYRDDVPSGEYLYNEKQFIGMTNLELSEKYNCGKNTIQRRISKYKKEMGVNG